MAGGPRRGRSLCALAVVVPVVLAGAARPAETPKPQARPVTEGVWLIPGGLSANREPDGNTVIFDDGRGGLVVMDTGRHLWQRQAILDFAKARGAPIVAIVNSHWHLDHVSGNAELKAAYPGAKVYASRAIDEALTGFLAKSAADSQAYLTPGKAPPETQEDIRADMATTANPAALRPDVPIDASRTVKFGALTLELNLAPNAATAGDVWVYDAQWRLAAVGDLVTLPAPFLDTACPSGWRAALARIWATPFEIAVPGHGQPMSRAQFTLYRTAFEGVIDCAASPRSKTECAAEWTAAIKPLLGPDPADAKRAQGMTEYYVGDVLRAGGDKNAACKNA